MPNAEGQPGLSILVAGATGYIGGRLIPMLQGRGVHLRCLARNPGKFRPKATSATEVVQGDVLDAASLQTALHGIHTAYYLVHLMAGAKDFAQQDRQAAINFAAAAQQAHVQRIIYMGGLGDELDPGLSPHLRSRHEVGRILASIRGPGHRIPLRRGDWGGQFVL